MGIREDPKTPLLIVYPIDTLVTQAYKDSWIP